MHALLWVVDGLVAAEADSAAAAKQDREDAPQLEVARVEKAADDLETARQNNLKSFRP